MNVLEWMRALLQDQNQEQLAAVARQAIDDERYCYQEAIRVRGQVREEVRGSGRNDQGSWQ